MKKFSLLLSAAILTSGAAQAQDNSPLFSERTDRPYAKLSVGANAISDSDITDGVSDGEAEFDNGYVVSGEVGYNFGQTFFIDNNKLGLEVGYSQNDLDETSFGGESDGDISNLTILANMYHEYDTETRFVPYYGVGAGASSLSANDFSDTSADDLADDEDWSFMYQLTTGVNYMVHQDVDLGVQYRFASTPNAKFSNESGASEEFDYYSHNFTVGATYNF